MDPIVDAKDVEKSYGSTRALDGMSLAIQPGSVFALLGPNGAGKTTFVRIVATQLLPSKGSVTVFGYDVVSHPREVREIIAVVPQEGRPFSLQTPFEHVITYLIARGVGISEAKRRADKTLNALNLQQYRNVICANLSGGLRQRVLIAMAMSTEAELLVLDEPTIGLDPVARVDVWNLVREYISEEGRTILLTTHYMDEAETLSDRLAIVNRGKAVAEGTPSQIRGLLNATHAVVIRTTTMAVGSESEETFHSELQSFGKVLKAGTGFRVLTSQRGAEELTSFCLKRGFEVSVRTVTLEDVFIAEVGQEYDVDTGSSSEQAA